MGDHALSRYAEDAAATGDRSRAPALYQQALAMNRELNNPVEEAAALEGIGEHYLSAGHAETGACYLSQGRRWISTNAWA